MAECLYQVALVLAERQVRQVTRSLSVGILADAGHDDVDILSGTDCSLNVGRVFLPVFALLVVGNTLTEHYVLLTIFVAKSLVDGIVLLGKLIRAMTLPRVAPSTVQTAHLVGVGTRNEQFLSFGKGQDIAFVLQQHHAFNGSVKCQLRKLLATELRIVLESLGRMLVESQSLLHAKNTADSIVDAAHGYLAFLHQLFQQDAGIHAVRFHNHIDTCIDGYAQSVFLVLSHSFAGIEIVDVGPVGNEHSVPSRLLFQPYGQQLMVGMNGHSVDGSRVDHDGSCPLTDSCKERSEVLLTQVGRGDIGWGAVFARPGHTIAQIVLQRYSHMLLVNMLGVVALET